ncbi:MAG: CHAT domain-containing protein [Bradymonadia bacterium]
MGARWGALGLLVLAGCQSAQDQCRGAIEARDDAQIVERCGALWRKGSRDSKVGLALARAHGRRKEKGPLQDVVKGMAGLDGEGAALRLLAKIEGRQGEQKRAVSLLEKALKVDRASNRLAEVAKDAQALAGLWWRQGRYQKALALISQAADAARGADDQRLMGFVRLAEGSIRNELGDARGAERAWRNARDMLEKASSGDRAWAALKLGRLRVEEGRMAMARVALEEALELGKGEARPDVMRAIHLNLSIAAMETGELEISARHMAEVDTILAKVPDARFQVTRDIFMGILRRYQGRLEESQKALAAAEAGVLQPELGWRAGLEAGLTAEAQGRLDAAAEAYARSIEHIESMRSDLTSEDLKGWFLGAKQAPYGALFALHARAGRSWQALAVQERALARMFIDAFVTRATGEGRAEYLRDLVPALGASKAVKPGASAEGLKKALGDQIIMGWFPEGERLWWIYLAHGVPQLRPLSITREALDKKVDALLSALAQPETAAGAAVALGEALIPADVELPPGPLHLVIPGGALARVPFALLRHRGHALVEHHEIALTPGLTALVAAEALAHADTASADPPIVLGDGRGDLPGAAEELAAVGDRLGVRPLTGMDASPDALREGRRARVMHIATHVSVGPSGGRLIMGGGATVDGAWIMKHNLSPQIAVLTGCASGATRGEGLWGSVASAFLAAGTPTAVAALWSVDDKATRRFAELLYAGEGLGAGVPKAVARAQRQLRAEGYAPKDWAPFVVIGAR